MFRRRCWPHRATGLEDYAQADRGKRSLRDIELEDKPERNKLSSQKQLAHDEVSGKGTAHELPLYPCRQSWGDSDSH